MRVLVTGGTGFIGRSLISHLLTQTSDEIVLLLREAHSNPALLPAEWTAARANGRLTAVYADLRHVSLTNRAVRQAAADRVIHLAAAGATDPFLDVETAVRHNLSATVNLLRACFEKAPPPQQLIVARTPGERSAMNVYAASKAAAWAFCQMYARTQGWPIVGAMIFQAYGPGQPGHTLVAAAVQAALRDQDFAMTAGLQQRDWIYLSDVVCGLTTVLRHNLAAGETIELGTGTATAVVDVVRLIYELVDGKGQPRPGVLPGRPGEDSIQQANAAHTLAQTGWQAATSLTEGLRQTIQTAQSTL